MEDSTRKLRAFHFKGILAAMLISCLAHRGRLLRFRLVEAFPSLRAQGQRRAERILSVNATNEETFTQLTEMNVPIRVVPVIDNRKQTIPRKFALVVDHAEDVGIEDIGDGKRAAIYFEKSSY